MPETTTERPYPDRMTMPGDRARPSSHASGEAAPAPRFVGLDRKAIADAQARFDKGDEHALVDCLEIMGTKRFMRAAPRDMKAELQATLKATGAQLAAKLRDARPKAKKPKARPQTVRTSQARPAAQPALSSQPEGAAELAAAIKRNRELLDGKAAEPKPEKLSQEEIAAMWKDAHERVARDSGRIR